MGILEKKMITFKIIFIIKVKMWIVNARGHEKV